MKTVLVPRLILCTYCTLFPMHYHIAASAGHSSDPIQRVIRQSLCYCAEEELGWMLKESGLDERNSLNLSVLAY